MTAPYFDIAAPETVYECSICFALVSPDSITSHDRWHETLKVYLLEGR